MPSPNIYQQLNLGDNTQNIRVLELEPLRRSQRLHDLRYSYTQPLFGTLRVISLTKGPRYAALSYVWGKKSSSNLRHTVRCNGQDLEITGNCQSALFCLRERFGKLSLWVDSICIDQNSIKERGHQVKLMGSIYGQAQAVYVWLSPDTMQTDYAWSSSARLSTDDGMLCLQRLGHRASLVTSHGYGLRDKQPQTGEVELLGTFVRNAWFRRGWTFQELVLASNPILLTSHHTLTWSNLCRAFESLQLEFSRALADPHGTSVSPLLDLASLVGVWEALPLSASRLTIKTGISEDIYTLQGYSVLNEIHDDGWLPWEPQSVTFVKHLVKHGFWDHPATIGSMLCGFWRLASYTAFCIGCSTFLMYGGDRKYAGPSKFSYTLEGVLTGGIFSIFHLSTGNLTAAIMNKTLLRATLAAAQPYMYSENDIVRLIIYPLCLAALLLYGPASFERLCKALMRHARLVELYVLFKIQYWRVMSWRETAALTALSRQRKLECWGIIQSLRKRKVTEPRDRAYALYGVLSALGAQLQTPDYSKPVEQVYKELFADLISWRPSSLALLLDAKIKVEQIGPSWVPRWDEFTNTALISEELLCSATSGGDITHLRKYGLPVCEARASSLIVCGHSFGRVTHVIAIPRELPNQYPREFDQEELRPTLQLLRRIRNIVDQKPFLSSTLRHQRLFDATISYIASRIKWKVPALSSFEQWAQAVFGCSMEDLKQSRSSSEYPRPVEAHKHVSQTSSAAASWVSSKDIYDGKHAYFFTDTGRIGIGPYSMKQGDYSYHISGVPLPMMLRNRGSEEKFEVIGPTRLIDVCSKNSWLQTMRHIELV
ncbi:Nn.00g083980.m01.CDS01 [Neocucurbitaria sp. VM-36]